MALDRNSMGPTLRSVTEGVDSAQAVFIPVTVNDVVHGIFQIERYGIRHAADLEGAALLWRIGPRWAGDERQAEA